MSERDDIDGLARDFVELWREHMEQQAADPAMARWMQAWIDALSGGGAGDAGTEGAAALGAASGDLGRRLDEFARRLARCEERLDALERGSRARRGRGPDPDRERDDRR